MYFSGLNHVHIKVSDVERPMKFYTEGFGMVVAETGFDGSLVTLTTPGTGDNLTVSQGVPPGLLDFTGDVEPGSSGGYDHFGYALKDVSDLDSAIENRVNLGATLVCALRPKRRARSSVTHHPQAVDFAHGRFLIPHLDNDVSIDVSQVGAVRRRALRVPGHRA